MNYAPPEIVLVSGGAILFERCKHAISFYKAEIFEKQKGLKKIHCNFPFDMLY